MSWILHQENKNLKQLLSGLNPKLILDIGTGTGSNLNLYPEDSKIVGIDSSIAMLKKAQSKHTFIKIAAAAENLPFKQNIFELISMIGVAEYLADLTFVLKESARILRPGGHLLMTIAPPSIWTILRRGLGNKLFPMTPQVIMDFSEKFGFKFISETKSLMQIQFIFQYV